MSNPGPLGAPGPVSVKVRQKVPVKSGPVSGPGPLGPSNPGGLAALVAGVYEYLQVNSKIFVRIGGHQPIHGRLRVMNVNMRHAALHHKSAHGVTSRIWAMMYL